MIRLVKIIFSLVLILYLFTFVSAQTSSTQVSLTNSGKSLEDEARRRRKHNRFGHQLWWWGLKALSILITVKIKIILLILFIGGGIFYGLKVWQGSALGCPEPIISEVKHHDFHDVIPYHGHFSPDVSYAGPPPDIGYSGPQPDFSSGYSGYDLSGVFAATPASYSSSFSSAGGGPPISSPSGPSSGPPDSSSVSVSGVSNTYLPPSNRRNVYTGRAMSESSANIFSDVMFRFLGVKSDVCKQRFICELDFRNPFMAYALNYIGNDVFKRFRLDKNSPKYPKKFSDCAKLFAECEIPKEGYSIQKRRRYRRRNQTAIEEETTTNAGVETVDLVTKYVKDQDK